MIKGGSYTKDKESGELTLESRTQTTVEARQKKAGKTKNASKKTDSKKTDNKNKVEGKN